MIEIAEATYGVDIKKKVGSRLSSNILQPEGAQRKIE